MSCGSSFRAAATSIAVAIGRGASPASQTSSVQACRAACRFRSAWAADDARLCRELVGVARSRTRTAALASNGTLADLRAGQQLVSKVWAAQAATAWRLVHFVLNVNVRIIWHTHEQGSKTLWSMRARSTIRWPISRGRTPVLRLLAMAQRPQALPTHLEFFHLHTQARGRPAAGRTTNRTEWSRHRIESAAEVSRHHDNGGLLLQLQSCANGRLGRGRLPRASG